MKIKKLIYQIEPPCPKCPYTLGLAHTPKNPCLECKLNHYETYEWFQKLLLREQSDKKKIKDTCI